MLIIFDVEGVLLNAEYLPVLAQVMGPRKEKEIWDITNAGIRGEINWEEGLRRRVQALRGISYEDAKKIGESLPIITDRLKDELSIDRIFSNELVFNNGKLEDVIMNVTSDKAAAIRPTITQWDIRKEDTVVVVDGANDLKLFALAGYTVGFCPVDMVREKADVSIDKRDLSLLLNLLKKNFGEAVLINAASRKH